MSRFAKLTSRWISNHGLTISTNDVAPDQSLIQDKENRMNDGYENC